MEIYAVRVVRPGSLMLPPNQRAFTRYDHLKDLLTSRRKWSGRLRPQRPDRPQADTDWAELFLPTKFRVMTRRRQHRRHSMLSIRKRMIAGKHGQILASSRNRITAIRYLHLPEKFFKT